MAKGKSIGSDQGKMPVFHETPGPFPSDQEVKARGDWLKDREPKSNVTDPNNPPKRRK